MKDSSSIKLFFWVLVLLQAYTFSQNSIVQNVRFVQRTDSSFFVDVYYDVNDPESDSMTVTMKVSVDDSTNWDFPCIMVTGDVGENISNGINKHIVWDFGTEHPNYSSNNFRIKIIAESVPRSPILVSPALNAEDQSVTPTLAWNESSNAVSYSLQISTNSDFTDLVFYQLGISSLGTQVAGLNTGTQYFWRVNATNNYGISGWSGYWSFTTGVPPNPPVLLSPVDGSLVQIINPILSWDASTTATSYTLQVSVDSSFTNIVYNQNLITGTSQQVIGLSLDTKFFWRVSATNDYGTSVYSTALSFKTNDFPCGSTIFYEGVTYNTVPIGTQCWFKENLNMGERIDGPLNQTNNDKIEKYCYDDNEVNCTIYGGLYQWAEAVQYENGATNSGYPNPLFMGNVQGICPIGWHIPSKVEFETLQTTVNNDINKLNASGFAILLGGFRHYYYPWYNSYFAHKDLDTKFWSSDKSERSFSYFFYLSSYINSSFFDYSIEGFSIRCLKD